MLEEQKNVKSLRAAPCAWAPIPAGWQGHAAPPRPTARSHLRAPPPPLRIQQRVPRRLHPGGRRLQRSVARRLTGGDDGGERAPLDAGGPVPPRIQEQAHPRPPAVQGLHQGGPAAGTQEGQVKDDGRPRGLLKPKLAWGGSPAAPGGPSRQAQAGASEPARPARPNPATRPPRG